jgi:hypothetical protein
MVSSSGSTEINSRKLHVLIRSGAIRADRCRRDWLRVELRLRTDARLEYLVGARRARGGGGRGGRGRKHAREPAAPRVDERNHFRAACIVLRVLEHAAAEAAKHGDDGDADKEDGGGAHAAAVRCGCRRRGRREGARAVLSKDDVTWLNQKI